MNSRFLNALPGGIDKQTHWAACLTFNWLGFVVIIACSLVAYALRISVEEKVLFQSLGEEYRRYAERTKRLIPGIF